MSLPQHFENKFEILHKISEGGMGAVYKVRHQLLDQIQVIKVIRPQHEDDEDLRRRFQREAKTAMQMRHKNIAAMHDFSIGEGGTAYIVMEFIDGRTLYDLLKESGKLPLDLVMEIARQSLDALDYLHRQGYVHRDISPDNLMVTRDSDGATLVKLIDLGVAKQIGGGRDLTTTGMFVGKARYSSPEQLSGKEPDQRSDVYSFAVMLYQLLTGSMPIEGTDFSSLVAGHLFRPPTPFAESDLDGRVPEGVRQAVLRALEKDPDQRIASADELSRLLAPFRTDIEATIQTPLESPRIPGRPEEDSADVRDPGRPSAEATQATAGRRARPRRVRETRHRSGRRPLLAALAAAAGLAIVAWGWWSLKKDPVVVSAWEEQYHQAVAAIEAGDLSGVPGLLRQARNANPVPTAAPQWATPRQVGPYLPYYFLGEAYYQQNNCVEALGAWRESERLGVVQTTPYYSRLQKSKADCQKFYDDAAGQLERTFERSAEFEKLLQEAIGQSAFRQIWTDNPELSQRVTAAIAGYQDLRTRFDAARDREDLDAVLKLEKDVLDSKEELDELAEQVVKLIS